MEQTKETTTGWVVFIHFGLKVLSWIEFCVSLLFFKRPRKYNFIAFQPFRSYLIFTYLQLLYIIIYNLHVLATFKCKKSLLFKSQFFFDDRNTHNFASFLFKLVDFRNFWIFFRQYFAFLKAINLISSITSYLRHLFIIVFVQLLLGIKL